MDTPVALIVFKRTDTLLRIAEIVNRAGPRRIYVFGDGPRPGVAGEAEACAAVRALIDSIPWQGELITEYSEVNLGSGMRPSSAFDRLFSLESQAIILEDDCVPDPTFFGFCEELLQRYADDERVMHISGRGIYPTPPAHNHDYYFTKSLSGWGWATWARAWRRYDFFMSDWEEMRGSRFLEDVFTEPEAQSYFQRQFEQTVKKGASSSAWDVQWNYCVWKEGALGIRPYVNLVEYAGFDQSASHTKQTDPDWYEHVAFPAGSVQGPLRHPPGVVRSPAADHFAIQRWLEFQRRRSTRRKRQQWFRRLRRLTGLATEGGRTN